MTDTNTSPSIDNAAELSKECASSGNSVHALGTLEYVDTGSVRPEYPLHGVIIDTETTGVVHRKDEIIEIGMIAFTFDDRGAIGNITGVYGGLR